MTGIQIYQQKTHNEKHNFLESFIYFDRTRKLKIFIRFENDQRIVVMEKNQIGLARKIHTEAQNLSGNENLFRNFIDALPAAVYTTDARGRLTHFNQAAIEFSGREPELGNDQWCVTWKLYHPDGTPMPHDQCPMAVALKEGRSVTGKEAIAERPDGKRVWFQPFPAPIRDNQGNIIGGINLLIDITERKRADLLLVKQNNLLELIASGAPLEKCLTTLCRVVPQLNPDVGACVLLTDEQGKAFKQVIAPDLPSSFAEKIEHVPIDSLGKGTCIEAINSGKPVSCADIAADKKRSKEWRELCIHYNISACHSKPVFRKDNEPAGSFMLSFNKPHEPGEWEIRLADFGAHITRIAVERELSQQTLQTRKKELSAKVTDLERLHTLSLNLLQQDDIKAALHEVMTASAELLKADKASVQMYNEQDDLLNLASTKNFPHDFHERFRIIKPDGITTCAAAIKQRKRVLVENLSTDPEFNEFHKASESYGVLAALSTPLFGSHGQLFGVFTMYWDNPHRPSENDMQLLDLYAQQAERQIERKRAEEVLKKRENRLKEDLKDSRLLQNISSQLIEEDNVHDLYKKILDAAMAIMNSDFAIIQILEHDQLRLLAHKGFIKKAIEYWQWVSPGALSSCGQAMEKAQRVIVPDIEKCGFMANTEDLSIYRQIGIKSIQSTPLFSRSGKMQGMLSTHWSRQHNPSDRDLRMLDILARQAADLIEQKCIEAELLQLSKKYKKQKRLYETIIASTPDLVYVFDLDYRFTFANKALLEMWGRTREESISKRLSELGYEPWHAEMHEREIDQVIETKQPIRGEVSFPHASLGKRIYDYIFVPVLNKEGEVEAIAGTTRDITERKESDYSNALLGAIIDGSDDAIISKNLDGIITSWNKGAERLFGYSDKEAIGNSVKMLIPQDRIHEEDKILEKINRGEHVEHFETVRQHKDGTLLEVSLTISPVQDSSGRIVGASKIARDISRHKLARKERENLLKKEKTERRQLAEIFQNSPSFMCILRGPDLVFERANDLFFQLVGDREIIGKPVREALPEVEGQGFFEILYQVYETGESFNGTDMEVTLNRGGKDNSEKRYLDFVYQPLREPSGKITGIFVQGIDLTERKRAKEELQAVNETLEERVKERTNALLSYQEQLRKLASALSKAEENERQRLATELHDNLGQTLAIGKMKLDLLQKKRNPDQAKTEIAELAELMNESIRYTRELMSDLKPPPSINKESLKETVAWISGKMKKFDLEVKVEDDGQPKPLDDEVRTTLCQCIRELLFNIVKHARVHEARITLLRHEKQVQVKVEDKGVGFNPDVEKMAPTKEGRFGLFNVLERMDLLGGSLEIISAPGKGTKALLVAPLKGKKKEYNIPDIPGQTNGKTEIQKVEVPKQKSHSKSKIRVLLVDDHQMMREGLRKIIEEEEDIHIIAEAADGKEAVKLSLEKNPDVVVMDINMPGMDGIQATKKIRAERSGTRIIGLSLHDNKNVARTMKKAGASAYLTKTEAFETLCATIRSEASILNKGKG